MLVEGDSELIVLPHIGRTLKPAWDFKSTSTSLVKISGKGSFLRYRSFFERFDVEVSLIADLDAILDGFDKLGASETAKALRKELIGLLDHVIDDENKKADPSPKLIREEIQRERFKSKLEQLKEARENGDHGKVIELLHDLFLFERTKPRLEVLKDHSRPEILGKKRELLAELRKEGVYVLEKGAIEAYYPPATAGADKPSKGQAFRAAVTAREHLVALCEMLDVEGGQAAEFDLIMGGIFGC